MSHSASRENYCTFKVMVPESPHPSSSNLDPAPGPLVMVLFLTFWPSHSSSCSPLTGPNATTIGKSPYYPADAVHHAATIKSPQQLSLLSPRPPKSSVSYHRAIALVPLFSLTRTSPPAAVCRQVQYCANFLLPLRFSSSTDIYDDTCLYNVKCFTRCLTPLCRISQLDVHS